MYFSKVAFSSCAWIVSAHSSKSRSSCSPLTDKSASKSCSTRNSLPFGFQPKSPCSRTAFFRKERRSLVDFGRIITGFSNTGTVAFLACLFLRSFLSFSTASFCGVSTEEQPRERTVTWTGFVGFRFVDVGVCSTKVDWAYHSSNILTCNSLL